MKFKNFVCGLLVLLTAMTTSLAAENVQTAEFYEYIDFSEMPVVSFFSSAEWKSDWTEYKDQLTGDALTIYKAFEEAFAEDSMSLETVNYGDGTSAKCWMKSITYRAEYASGKFEAVVNEWYNDICDDVILACWAFAHDNPEYFWIRQSYSFGYSASGSGGVATITLRVGFTAQSSCDTENERSALQEKLTKVIEGILNDVKNLTTVQKLEYFDNWLAANNNYNSTAAANTSDYIKTDDTPWSIVGALLDDYSPVCEGYAKAFQLLCHKVGVPCVQVSGVANGGEHMWTAVQLGGTWYFCDPTWDDPIINGEATRDYSTREYFLTAQPGTHAVGMPLITPTISNKSYSDNQKYAPTDLAWGTYWFETENGAQGIPVAGMISWKVADTTIDNEYQVQVFRKGTTDTLVYKSTYLYSAGMSEFCTEYDFSNLIPQKTLTSGDYYFTVQNTAGGAAVTSDTWTYKNPGVTFTTKYISRNWTWPTAEWDECDDEKYRSYNCGYVIEYWYSAREGEATSVDDLTRLGGYVWYFDEGRIDRHHVIPKELVGNKGYYYFTVRFLSTDVSVVSHTGRMISEAYYYNGTVLTSGIDKNGILTIVDTESAGDGYTTTKTEGWVWENGTLTLKAVEGVTIKAVRFLPYVGGAKVVLNSDFTLDATGVRDPADEYGWEKQPALDLESMSHELTIQTGEYTLTCISDGHGIYSGGSLTISGSKILAEGTQYCIYVSRGNITIVDSRVEAPSSLYGWGIYAHGIRHGESRICQMGDLTMEKSTVIVTSSEQDGRGNAVYADGDISIISCVVDANGDNNGIGNDVGDIIIQNSDVRAVGEKLGICTYGTLKIDSSSVYAEGIRAIEICRWKEDVLPQVTEFELIGVTIVTPEKAEIRRVAVSQYDQVLNVVDLETGNSAAIVQIVVPINLEGVLTDWANQGVTVADVQKKLDGHASEIASKLADDQNEADGVTELIRAVEGNLTGVEVKIAAEDAFAGAQVIGAKLNAAGDSVVLKIEAAEPKHEDAGKYSAMTAFSMTLEGAVDADAEEGLQLVVPVKITLPVPANINPAFLVVLHYTGNSVEEIVPYVYWQAGQWYASFVVTSFSDFALASVTISAETEDNGVAVKVKFAVDLPGSAICAVYDAEGRQIGVTVLDSMTAGEHGLTIACDQKKAASVKLFILDENGVPAYVESPCQIGSNG